MRMPVWSVVTTLIGFRFLEITCHRLETRRFWTLAVEMGVSFGFWGEEATLLFEGWTSPRNKFKLLERKARQMLSWRT
jgi:hypothetical protein